MRRQLLISTATAAILSGFMFASAQEMPRGGKQEGVIQNQGPQGGTQRQPRQAMPEGQSDEQGQREKGKAKQAQPKVDQNRDRQRTTGQGQPEQGKAKQAQPKPDRNRNQQQTTGQGQRDQGKAKQAQPKTDQSGASDQTAGQGRQPEQQQDRQGRQDAAGTSARGRIDLNVEQRTRIRQTVFARSDVPRVTNVNFSVSVGTVVPTRVRVVSVPAAIIEIRPEFRNHLYFVVREEIVIVDNRRRIVAVIPVDTARGGGGVAVSSGVDVVDLSPDEIRQVQLVLIERGFSVEADGVFGPRTRQALIQFQRREGLAATGRIDSRTVTSLGVSISSSQQPSTTGQGGGSQNSPANRGSGGAQSNAPQKSPMDQGKQSGAAPSGGQSGDQSQSGSPTTTGQGGGASAPTSPRSSGGAGNPAAQPKSPTSGAGSPSGGSASPSGGSSGGGQQ